MKAIDEEVLDYIIEYKKAHDGLSPTMRQMCETLTISSTSQAALSLERLAMAGKIKRLPGMGGIMVTGGRWYLERRPVYAIGGGDGKE